MWSAQACLRFPARELAPGFQSGSKLPHSKSSSPEQRTYAQEISNSKMQIANQTKPAI
jgi:hypothetical protein